MTCYLCGTRSKKRKYMGYVARQEPYLEVDICIPCWDEHDGNVKEAVLAKKKNRKKEPETQADTQHAYPVRPCAYCDSTDFKNDMARRAHQGRCSKNPKNLGKKFAGVAAKKEKETFKRMGIKPPELTKPEKAKSKRKVKAPKPPRTKSQIGRGSRQKGSAYENKLKKVLATWWGEAKDVVGTKRSAFQRSPGSGGTSPANWPLDIYVPDAFPWAVEAKNREGDKGLECMERFFTGDYPVIRWFREAERELIKAKISKPLLLVFTRNQYPDFAALRRPVSEGQFMTFFMAHMTLCDRPYGEILVVKLENLLKQPPGEWRDAYEAADEMSYLPRQWR